MTDIEMSSEVEGEDFAEDLSDEAIDSRSAKWCAGCEFSP